MKADPLFLMDPRVHGAKTMAYSKKFSSGGWCVPSEIRLTVRTYLVFQIVEGTARQLIGVFDVKKRAYFGNTSMEAEISLLMANQTLVSI
jgi:tRNA G10  N-methylase Trm11